MKILFLHLSDMHIIDMHKADYCIPKKICNALQMNGEFDKLFLIFSGDLTNSGIKSECISASKFIKAVTN